MADTPAPIATPEAHYSYDEDDEAPEHLTPIAAAEYSVDDATPRETLIEIGIRFERKRIAAALTSSKAEIERVTRERDQWQRSQTYTYIGRDGKAVLARVLEDRVATLTAEVGRMREALTAVLNFKYASLPGITHEVFDNARAALASPIEPEGG